MLLVYCQGKESKNRGEERERKRRQHMPENQMRVLLTEIPGARLRGSDGGKSCSFR